MDVKITLGGDWALAQRIAQTCARDVKTALRAAIRQEAEDCRSQMIQGIVSQSPGGQAFKPLAASTLAFRRAAAAGSAIAAGGRRVAGINSRAQSQANARGRQQMMANARGIMAGSNRALATAQRQATRATARAVASVGRQIRRAQSATSWRAIGAGMKATQGSKILIQSGDLLGGIRAIHRGDTSFIGIMRSARSKNGRSLYNLARIHEFGWGPKAVVMTPKQRAYLAMMFKRIGTLKMAKGGGGVLIVRGPARPFIAPIFEQLYGDDLNTMKRIERRLSSLLPLAQK